VLPPAAAAAPPASAPAPVDNGKGTGKADKEDRTPQSTTQPTETTPAPVVEPPAKETDQGHGNDKEKDKSDKSDKSDNGNDGDANTGAAKTDKGVSNPEKPTSGNDAGRGNDKGKGDGKGK
jgi:hypothetical protein